MSDSTNVADLSLTQLAAQLLYVELTSARLTDACLERIETLNPQLNAFITVTTDTARAEARAADDAFRAGHDRGPLQGIPMSLKDLLDQRGVPTTAGSQVLGISNVATTDASSVHRLRDAGAVFVGKTNLHEFAYGTTNEDSGFGPVRNPHDRERISGGSSGGSAVAVATGMSVASIGTDTGGSIRIPAAACGVVGLKPAYDEVSRDGVIPLSGSFDHVGPIARTVEDAWIVHAVLTGHEKETLSPRPLGRTRFGVLKGYFTELLDDEVRSGLERVVTALRSEGAEIFSSDIPDAPKTADAYARVVSWEAYRYHSRWLHTAADRYTPGVRTRLDLAAKFTEQDYREGLSTRELLRDQVTRALETVDVLMLPALAVPAPHFGDPVLMIGGAEHRFRPLSLRLTQLFNVTGHPAVSVPGGRLTNGMPWALQLVGRTTRDLMGVALAVERFVASQSLDALPPSSS